MASSALPRSLASLLPHRSTRSGRDSDVADRVTLEGDAETIKRKGITAAAMREENVEIVRGVYVELTRASARRARGIATAAPANTLRGRA